MDGLFNDGVKTCSRCRESKSRGAFSRRAAAKDGLQGCCKACQAAMDRVNYARNPDRRARILRANERRRRVQTARLQEIKAAAGCADCGERDPVVLDFDHREGSDKLGDVATMTGGPWRTIEAEVAKCDVVCANCHRRRTHARRVAAAGRSTSPTLSRDTC